MLRDVTEVIVLANNATESSGFHKLMKNRRERRAGNPPDEPPTGECKQFVIIMVSPFGNYSMLV